jgi:AcrR family transcriptional regulator
MQPRPSPALSAPEIVRVALALLRSGHAPISMRKLASEFGVSATALYRYFPDRRSLYEAVSDEVIKEIVEADQGGAWTTRLRALMVAQQRTLIDAPGVAQFLFENQDSVPAMRWMNAILRVLLDAGFPPHRAVRALTTVIFYVNPAFFVGESGERRGATVRGTSPLFRSPRNRAKFPALSAVIDELAELSYEDQYVVGADRLIAGLAAELSASVSGSRSPGPDAPQSSGSSSPIGSDGVKVAGSAE